MRQLFKHFRTFDSFIKLLYSIRNTINQGYYRYFNKTIREKLSKEVLTFHDNKIFKNLVEELIFLPDNFSRAIQENESNSIILEADHSMNHIFNILGSGEVTLNPIDWHTDFKTGFKWGPGIFYKDYIQEGIDKNSDVKVPRELSRCHHLIKLGVAFQITNNEKYANSFISQIEDWIRENSIMQSINWGCTMDVAIRAVNWIWTLRLISNSLSLSDESLNRIKVSLYEHGWFIFRNPEKMKFNNHNHYLADLSGQIHLGLLFNGKGESNKWLETGKRELFKEIRIQILPSGMSYERSTNYNRLVLELTLIPILLLKRNGHEIPIDIWYRVEKMFEFLMFSLKPDGTSPIIGDQDDARLLPFGNEKNTDFRYLLSLGALLFHRSDFKQYGNGFNIYCLIFGGPKSLEKFDQIQISKRPLSSIAFPDAGLYFMRKNNNYFAFVATGKGLYPELNSGTHTHSDLLSFELFVKGKSFLVDPGTYVYTADAEQRMLFRSTKMHNTLTVDNESQNVICKEVLWNFERNAIPQIIVWETSEKEDKIVGCHSGYSRFTQPVIHQRSVIFDKENIQWQIKDELLGEGNHLFEWYFHFDTGIDFLITKNKVHTICEDGNNLTLNFSGDFNFQIRKANSFVSKSYGVKKESFVLIVSSKGNCPIELIIDITPTN